jgi:hypothetical protein
MGGGWDKSGSGGDWLGGGGVEWNTVIHLQVLVPWSWGY